MYNDFREYSAAFYDKQSDIYHHGVKGMRWGVITWMDKLKQRLGLGVGNKRDPLKDRVIENAQEVANVGNSIIRNRSLTNSQQLITDSKEYSNKWWELSRKNPDSSAAKRYLDKYNEAVNKAVNEWSTFEKYNTNCPNCTLALELKKRGMEVKPKVTGGRSMEDIHEIYVNEKSKECKTNKDFWNAANYGKPGDHGAIAGYYNNYMGHIFNYTVLPGGKVQLEDAQSGRIITMDEARKSGDMPLSLFQSGEIINLTKAEVDMDTVRKFNMVDMSNYRNGNDMKLRQYEAKVKKFVANRKKAEKFLLGIINRLSKKKRAYL